MRCRYILDDRDGSRSYRNHNRYPSSALTTLMPQKRTKRTNAVLAKYFVLLVPLCGLKYSIFAQTLSHLGVAVDHLLTTKPTMLATANRHELIRHTRLV